MAVNYRELKTLANGAGPCRKRIRQEKNKGHNTKTENKGFIHTPIKALKRGDGKLLALYKGYGLIGPWTRGKASLCKKALL